MPQKLQLIYILSIDSDKNVTCTLRTTSSPLEAADKETFPFNIKKFVDGSPNDAVTAEDSIILMRLYAHQAINARNIQLAGTEGFQLAKQMVESNRCFWKSTKSNPLIWGWSRNATLNWRPERDDTETPVIETLPPTKILLPLTPPLYIDKTTNASGEIQTDLPAPVLTAWAKSDSRSPSQRVQFLKNLTKRFPGIKLPHPKTLNVQTVRDAIPIPHIDISRTIVYEGTDQEQAIDTIHLTFGYEGNEIAHNSNDKSVRVMDMHALRVIPRNNKEEEKAISRLKTIGLDQLKNIYPNETLTTSPTGFAWKPNTNTSWYQVLYSGLRELAQEGWILSSENTYNVKTLDNETWYTDVTETKPNWFELEAGILIDNKKVNLLPIVGDFLKNRRTTSIESIKQELSGSPYFALIDGSKVMISGDRFLSILLNLFELFDKEIPFQKNNRLLLDTIRIAELENLDSDTANSWPISGKVQRLRRMLASKNEIDFSQTKLPPQLNAELRPYQKVGLGWLQFLREYHMNGILADDMGLGKTVQTLAHLLVEQNAHRLHHPTLIIAPTSLMKNWHDEIQKFAPSLNAICLIGPNRHNYFELMDKVDIVLTTYPLLRQDEHLYRTQHFYYIILDEAQYIKNAKSQLAKSVYQLQSTYRLCLSGTPLENHLGELWSLFNFLMPGLLGNEQSFKERYRTPIEKNNDEDRKDLLCSRISPFLLRRKKDEVARDLPPKFEIIQTLELSNVQRDLYETVRIALESKIRQEIAQKGIENAQIVILDALLKLRQVCCDPRLLKKKNADVYTSKDSIKLKGIRDMLPQMIEEGRRVLLFSQFTSMLALIEEQVNQLGIRYVKLTGATKDRGKLVDQFQKQKVPLFLISLKAGGTGLNLTTADTVIHFDPWWNPAVESQATDRAYRIGQTNPVFVYKLITENTVESKIVDLQSRKKRLADAVLSKAIVDKLQFDEEDLAILFGQ